MLISWCRNFLGYLFLNICMVRLSWFFMFLFICFISIKEIFLCEMFFVNVFFSIWEKGLCLMLCNRMVVCMVFVLLLKMKLFLVVRCLIVLFIKWKVFNECWKWVCCVFGYMVEDRFSCLMWVRCCSNGWYIMLYSNFFGMLINLKMGLFIIFWLFMGNNYLVCWYV